MAKRFFTSWNIKNINLNDSNVVIENKKINIEYSANEKKHFSKETKNLLTKEEIKLMELGSEIHEQLEYSSFNESSNKYVNNLLNHFNNFINVYKEYEFIYEKDNKLYNGIIDLMLEYDNKINIIDYKLKNINDSSYINQLKGYQEYIKTISNKEVSIYLYSILDDKIKKID